MSNGRSTSNALRHPIGMVARRTGLKPDLIRAWERRYGAVTPGRSETRRRFYSDEDIERLLLLRRVVSTGRGISQIAGLSNEELTALIEKEPAPPAARQPASAQGGGEVEDLAEAFLGRCLAAAQRLDVRELEMQLDRAAVAFSRTNLIEKLLVPLMQRIGDLWHQGALRPIHEHMASSVVRSFLGGMHGAYQSEVSAPHMVITTPARQHHELGALLAAATAAGEGWQVTYLGPELPPEEIAAAALQKGARAVGLSITYPPDDPLLGDDLRRLRRLLDNRTALVVGGRSATAYGHVLQEIGAHRVADLAELRRELEALRSAPETQARDTAP
ncbi:MAG TPA: cobalamin-dependent protein [Thermoanaerobaculia bacterium]|nr:cobalamin-dependent protein [Thermoanaerobaculia bacterium]